MVARVPPLADRYRLVRALKPAGSVVRWIGLDGDTGSEVVAAVVDAGHAVRLEAVKAAHHLHLAAVLDVVRAPAEAVVPAEANPTGALLPVGFAVAVAELVPGSPLRALLSQGPLHNAKIVAWTLRLADALKTLHDRGSVHGALSPRSVVAKPATRAIAPVLSQLLVPALGAYCSPERLRGASPTTADDVWALHALLYTGLTGRPPFEGTTSEALLASASRGLTSIAGFGIHEPVLQEILSRGLRAEKGLRVTDLDELTRCLDAWERMEPVLPPRNVRMSGAAPRSLAGIVSGASGGGLRDVVLDETQLADDDELAQVNRVHVVGAPMPGPTQASTAIGASVLTERGGLPSFGATVPGARTSPRPSTNPFASKRARWPYAVGVGAAVVGAMAYLGTREEQSLPRAPEASEIATAGASPAARPKPPENPLSPEERLTACVAAYFPEDTFEEGVEFGFVCQETDLRVSSDQLYEASEVKADRAAEAAQQAYVGAIEARRLAKVAVGRGEDAAVPPPPDPKLVTAERARRPLGWYELAATTVIRRGCCQGAAPIKLPEIPGWCEQLQDVLREFADESEKVGDLAPKAKRFDKAIQCLFATGVKRPYDYKKPTDETNSAAFQRFLSHAAMVDAKRHTTRTR